MAIPLEGYDEVNNVFGKPQVIKGVSFYPMKMLDADQLSLFNFLFSYSKSQMYHANHKSILEKKISHPWINVFLSQYQQSIDKEGLQCIIYLKEFLRKICRISDPNNIKIGYSDKSYLYNCETCIDKDVIIQITQFLEDKDGNLIPKFINFSSQEFDNIRKMIIVQNGKDYDWIDAWNESWEEALNEYYEVEKDKINISSLEDDILTYRALSNISYETIEDMTIYQFYTDFGKRRQIYEFSIYEPFRLKGLIKQNDWKHYTMAPSSRDRYSEIRVEMKTFKKSNPIMNLNNNNFKQ